MRVVHASTTLPPDRSSPRAAREFVWATIEDFGDEETRHSVALLTSELVTNAVLHAGTEFDVTVVRDDRHVRVGVKDGDRRLPQPATTSHDASTGRGLRLVDAMASAWGVEDRPDGKFVWFEVVPEQT